MIFSVKSFMDVIESRDRIWYTGIIKQIADLCAAALQFQ